MPIHLLPNSRRGFLRAGLASTAAACTSGFVFGQKPGETPPSNRWALIADSHVAADPTTKRGEAVMADLLKAVVAEILARPDRHAGMILHGDCSYIDGQAGDYTTLTGLLKPLREAERPLHFLLGNHDDRVHFLMGVQIEKPGARPLVSHHVSVIETPLANLFLLDSLDEVNKTPGRLGSEQLAWLASELDKRPDKPAIIHVHHNPVFAVILQIAGLKDTTELWKVLAPRKQVKAVLFGHTHHWSRMVQSGIHCINLPPASYVFQKGDPSGWVEMLIEPNGARLELFAHDRTHKSHGEKVSLAWRS